MSVDAHDHAHEADAHKHGQHGDKKADGGGSHHHAHIPTGGAAFAVGIGLNIAFTIIEVIYGIAAHSMALVADAAHNLGDVLGLGLAWAATALAKRKPSSRHTYGLRRTTILATLANAILLLVAIGGVIWEAIGRLRNPGDVVGSTIIVVAAIGVFINGVSALFFFRGKDHDANVRGAFLHLAADAAVSLGVVIGGVIILKTGWKLVDPLISILVSLVILGSTWSLFKGALNSSLDAVPDRIDLDKVRAYLCALPHVEEVHDLHVWAMSTTEVALTAHVAMPWAACPPTFLRDLAKALERDFGIAHATVQIEPVEVAPSCVQSPADSL